MRTAVAVAEQNRVSEARAAQASWSSLPVAQRLRPVRKLRSLLSRDARALLGLFPAELPRTAADTLTSELLPLADACRFLELAAARILSPLPVATRGRPLWMRGVQILTLREPLGVVLVIGPSNYPLFLAAVQSLQALVAGNAVLLKPGRGASAVLRAFARMTLEAGFPPGLFTLLDEEISSAQNAIADGVDKIVVTGSLETGKAVLRAAADRITPVVCELSGQDPVFILPGADLERAAAAIAFAARLNGGNTCIAPKRVFVHASLSHTFRARLAQRLAHLPSLPAVLFVSDFTTDDEALGMAAAPYALGASVFGTAHQARRFAPKLCAGIVVINDVIVPTADPRVSFGGRKWSGFGKTRGPEGLLEMTVAKTVVTQKARRLRHLEPLPDGAEDLFLALAEACHREGLLNRLKGWINLCKQALRIRANE